EDLVGLVEVDYDPRPAVSTAEAAMAPGAPIVHSETNVAEVLEYDIGDTAWALASAPHTFTERFVIQRQAGTPLETRGVIVEWDHRRDGITVWSSTQIPHSLKAAIVGYLGISENAVRVIAPDVGGAFGVKLQPYPEEIVLAFAAQSVGR
ncbi:MAG: molybdopterin cofactor-binding domain-containing protein, partial [Planctomycetaceae bacterium]